MIKLEPLLLQTQGEKCESGRQQGRGAGCWQLGNHQLRRCRMFNMRGSASRASERASGERLDPVGKIRLGFLKNQSLATQSRFTQDSPGQSSWRLNSGFTKQSRKIRPGNCKREHTGVAEWRGCRRPHPGSPEVGGAPASVAASLSLPLPTSPCPPHRLLFTPAGLLCLPSAAEQQFSGVPGAQESLRNVQRKKAHLCSGEQSGVPA